MIPTRHKFVIVLIFVVNILAATVIGFNIYLDPIRQMLSTAFIFTVTYAVVRRYFKEEYEENLRLVIPICFFWFAITCFWGIILSGLTIWIIGNSVFQICSEDTITKTAYGLTVVYAAILARVIDVMDELEAWK